MATSLAVNPSEVAVGLDSGAEGLGSADLGAATAPSGTLNGEDTPLIAADTRLKGIQVEASKDIGWVGSFVYLFVQNYGFAILSLPLLFQQAGLVVTTVCLFFFSVLASYSASLLVEAMSLIPGNEKFEKNIEYVGVVEYYFGRRVYYFFQFVLNTSLQSSNIASIRITCQAVDSLIVLIFGRTWALRLTAPAGFVAISADELFSTDQIVIAISVGYVVITAGLIPLGLQQLKENIKVQFVSLGLVTFCVVVFVWHFTTVGMSISAVPVFNTQLQQLLGVLIFSLGFASMVPSWVNQRRPEVSPRVVIWSSSAVVMVLNFVLPLMGAFAYPHLNTDDLLEAMGQYTDPSTAKVVITKVAVYLYTLSVITASIPVYCITIKNNLYTGGVFSSKWSTFCGAIAPFIVAWLFNSGAVFATLLNWASLLLTCFIAFYFPFLSYLKGQTEYVKRHGHPGRFVGMFPQSVLKYWRPLVIFFFLAILIPTIFQIGLDMYYLIFLHINVLG